MSSDPSKVEMYDHISLQEKTLQEDRDMWLYVQTWFPLLTVALTAAICFGVVSSIMGQPRTPPTHKMH